MRKLVTFTVATVLALFLVPPTQASAEAPSVVIVGEKKIGVSQKAVISGVEGDIDYQWTIDGVPTAQKTLPTGSPVAEGAFFLLEEYLGHELALSVVVTPDVGDPVTLRDGPYEIASGQILSRPPTVTGEPRVGQTLAAKTNVIYPTDGVVFTYQWLGRCWLEPVEGATQATFVIPEVLVEDCAPRVEVSASKPGWETTVLRSANTRERIIAAEIPKPTITASSAPVVLKKFTVWVDTTQKGTGEVDVRIRWTLDGAELPGETSDSLLPAADWVGKEIEATATVTRPNGQSVTVSTGPLVVRPARLSVDSWVLHSQAIVGWPLRLNSPALPPGGERDVTWVRVDSAGRESVIPGAKGPVYRLTAADVGYKVGARVRTKAPGYESTNTLNTTVTPVVFSVYTTPGQHTVNGRQWRTTCEPYSQTLRCRTEIWATQVQRSGNRYVRQTGWAFNNLTYLPLSSGVWGSNPLAKAGEWVDSTGRQWRTECGMPKVGRDTCRTYARASVVSTYMAGGQWRYRTSTEWVFNNMVYTA